MRKTIGRERRIRDVRRGWESIRRLQIKSVVQLWLICDLKSAFENPQ